MLLRDLPPRRLVLIDVLLGTFVGDTAAYAGGKLFGRHKMAPALSPNKTIEGLVVGMVGAMATVWFAGLYQDWLTRAERAAPRPGRRRDRARSATSSSATSSATSASRTPARAFGAHGGALDRLDAVLFTIVVGYYVWFAMAADLDG